MSTNSDSRSQAESSPDFVLIVLGLTSDVLFLHEGELVCPSCKDCAWWGESVLARPMHGEFVCEGRSAEMSGMLAACLGSAFSE